MDALQLSPKLHTPITVNKVAFLSSSNANQIFRRERNVPNSQYPSIVRCNSISALTES